MNVRRTLLLSLVLLPLLALLPGVFLSGQVAAPADRLLVERQGAFGSIFVVEDAQGLRTLQFERNGARQSVVRPGDPDHLELPYAQAILSGMTFVDKPQRVLIVGLGGGSIPMFLRKHYPQMTIDVVEIDPAVVRVAGEYFGFREDRAMKAHVADGRAFIEKVREPYDVIFLDAYGADSIPYHLATREFLDATLRAAKPSGAVVSNIWSQASNKLYDRMVRTYQDAFAELYIVDARKAGNKILIALPKARKLDLAAVEAKASAMTRQERLRFDLGEIVKEGFGRAFDKDPAVGPLTDKQRPEG